MSFEADIKCQGLNKSDRYQDQAAFEKHLSQPYFTKFTEDIMPLIVEEQEMGQGATVAGFTR